MGGALAALSNFSTCFFGWKNTYIMAGLIGIGAGAVGLTFLKEPTPELFDPDASLSMREEAATVVLDESGAATLALPDGAVTQAEAEAV